MSKCDYQGIDYGRGMSNVDGSTGIRYGVIQHDKVGQVWWDESEANYLYFCPKCETELGYEYPDVCSDPECGYEIQDGDFDMQEPMSFSYDRDGYACEQGYDDPDIFILKSPFYTWCQYCSPCAPGAGYVMNWMEKGEGIKAYCFGHDWFEETETDKLVKCKYCHGTNMRPEPSTMSPQELARKRMAPGYVTCWACDHGWTKKMIQKAPYPVYRVDTDELVEVQE